MFLVLALCAGAGPVPWPWPLIFPTTADGNTTIVTRSSLLPDCLITQSVIVASIWLLILGGHSAYLKPSFCCTMHLKMFCLIEMLQIPIAAWLVGPSVGHPNGLCPCELETSPTKSLAVSSAVPMVQHHGLLHTVERSS